MKISCHRSCECVPPTEPTSGIAMLLCHLWNEHTNYHPKVKCAYPFQPISARFSGGSVGACAPWTAIENDESFWIMLHTKHQPKLLWRWWTEHVRGHRISSSSSGSGIAILQTKHEMRRMQVLSAITPSHACCDISRLPKYISFSFRSVHAVAAMPTQSHAIALSTFWSAHAMPESSIYSNQQYESS